MEAARTDKHGQPVDVLRTGDRIIITQGPFENSYAHVVNPVPVPDKDDQGNPVPNRRKVLVLLEGEDTEIYILPRQVELAAVQHKEQAVTNTAAIVDSMDITQTPDRPVISFEEAVGGDSTIDDPMHPALDQFRPDPSVVERYTGRKVPGGYTDVEFMLALREQRGDTGYSPNVALVGPTQAGKTMFVEVLAVLAAERDGMPKPYPVFTLNGSSGISNYDLFGKTTAVIIDGQEVLVWMEGVVAMALRCGGILYLDEWNAVPSTQAVALHPVLDDRRQFTNTHRAVPNGHGGFMPEVIHAHPNLWTISTINPLGYKGTQAMAEATSNRFRWFQWDYNEEVEEQIIPADAVRDFGQMIRNNPVIKTPVGTSALQRLNQDLSVFGVEVALWSFLAMFQTDRDRMEVEEMIELNSIKARLDREYDDREIEPS